MKFTGHGGYLVRKLYKPDSPESKFMETYLYPLPTFLKPYEPVDSSDIKYLNQSHSRIVNSLRKPFNIELYNKTWYDKTPRTSQPLFDYNHPTLALLEPQLTPFTSLSDLHAETNKCHYYLQLKSLVLTFFLIPPQ